MERAPDVAGPLIGWRAWRLASRGGTFLLGGVPEEVMLWSYFSPIMWPPRGALRAICRNARTKHDPAIVPSEDCRCGIYGFREPEGGELRWIHDNRERVVVWLGGVPVLGRVALWGRVRVGQHGWRAQYARPVALVPPKDASAILRRSWEHVVSTYELNVVPSPYD